jgi:hypothetical protein
MFTIKLLGGLGNQMFQYALGRHLATKNKTELVLDISDFQHYKLHKYSLGAFNIRAKILNEKRPNQNLLSQRIVRKLKKIFSFLPNNFIDEPTPHFAEQILNTKNNKTLTGYWQSEKYFKDIEEIIKKDFTLNSQHEFKDKQKLELIKKIKSCNSISLHIRRGDYVNLKFNTNLEYYKNSIKFMQKNINSPVFFIFSDDINWVKKNLKIEQEHFYIQGNKNYEDITLMSLCKHNITANSTFSWWGAWLNNNKNKTVTTPKIWFLKTEYNTKDLIPNSWIKI